jgi:hypothetical protein
MWRLPVACCWTSPPVRLWRVVDLPRPISSSGAATTPTLAEIQEFVTGVRPVYPTDRPELRRATIPYVSMAPEPRRSTAPRGTPT